MITHVHFNGILGSLLQKAPRLLFSVAFVILFSFVCNHQAMAGNNGNNGGGNGGGGNGGGGNGGGGSPPPIDAALAFLESQIGPVGLVDSFVDDRDDFSYTYDNAITVLAFTSHGNLVLAEQILDAFLMTIPSLPEGGFLHRYDSQTGGDAGGVEALGHNTYLLQAINLYHLEQSDPVKKTKYDALAQQLASYILSFQDNNDGGLIGRPGATWKSTENNLGAYCAIHNYAFLQSNSDYLNKASAIQSFLTTECWDQSEMRFNTGKNDPMVVTDAQALGTLVLYDLDVMYANGSYWIEDETRTLTTKRYSGRKTVTGFDLNTDRDTCWTEGTLQQALAFYVSGDLDGWVYYLEQSEKLIQSSGAFFQASNRGTTGFGEYFEKWEAVAPTAWYVCAHNQDNVLRILP